MKKILSLIAVLWLSVVYVSAQTDTTTIIKQSTGDTTKVTVQSSSNVLNEFLVFVVDQNKKKDDRKQYTRSYAGWHVEPYFGFGFIAGGLENSNAKMIYGESYSLDFGLKSRYQFTGIYSLTFNVGFMHNRYKIADGVANDIIGAPLPFGSGNFVVNSERFRTWAFGVSLGHRFNFCKTRELKGYVEAGLYGNYAFSRNYIVNYKGDNEADATLYYKNSNIFNPFEAGAQVNIGFHWFSIWGRYRLTDWFNTDYTEVKMPRLVIGAAINL